MDRGDEAAGTSASARCSSTAWGQSERKPNSVLLWAEGSEIHRRKYHVGKQSTRSAAVHKCVGASARCCTTLLDKGTINASNNSTLALMAAGKGAVPENGNSRRCRAAVHCCSCSGVHGCSGGFGHGCPVRGVHNCNIERAMLTTTEHWQLCS